jgi:hypothetical protein
VATATTTHAMPAASHHPNGTPTIACGRNRHPSRPAQKAAADAGSSHDAAGGASPSVTP